MKLPTGGITDKVTSSMIRPQRKSRQGEFWIAHNELARAQASRFYDKLDETLEEMEFTSKVHGVCAPLYSSGEKGGPRLTQWCTSRC
jgi:hypothetical protein